MNLIPDYLFVLKRGRRKDCSLYLQSVCIMLTSCSRGVSQLPSFITRFDSQQPRTDPNDVVSGSLVQRCRGGRLRTVHFWTGTDQTGTGTGIGQLKCSFISLPSWIGERPDVVSLQGMWEFEKMGRDLNKGPGGVLGGRYLDQTGQLSAAISHKPPSAPVLPPELRSSRPAQLADARISQRKKGPWQINERCPPFR